MTEQPRPAAARVRDSEYHVPVVVEIRQAAPPGIHEMTEHVARRLIQGMWG
jgi:hypothetical protein